MQPLQFWIEYGSTYTARDLGHDPQAIVARAQSAEVKDRLKQQTERAKALKIFGAPSFIAAGELFWGDDRLEEAIEWAATH